MILNRLREHVSTELARSGRRRRIELVDGTLRDAHQCLWATRMRTEHMLPMARRLDEAGFEHIEALGLVQVDVMVQFLNENPFERIRLLSERITRTPLRGAVRSNLLRFFSPVASDVSELWTERLIASGIREVIFLESLHHWENVASSMAAARRLGAKIVVPLQFTLAEAYDDAFYVAQARKLVEDYKVDVIMLMDTGGSLTAERVRTLVPALKAVIGSIPLEVNVHCLNAIGPWVAIEAAVYGADRLMCAIEPLANGNSLPSAQMLARNLRILGFDVNVDDRALDTLGEYLRGVAEENGFPLGIPSEYDPIHFKMQFAGGALSNMEAQLARAGILDKLPAVLDEVARVREELGSPPMATPFPAMVAAQAVMNVMQGERYLVIPDEVKMYVCGHYGPLPMPVDPAVKERVLANGSRDVSLSRPPLEPALPKLRKQYGNISDDELLIRYMFGDERFRNLQPAPIDDHFSVRRPLVDLLDQLATLAHGRSVRFSIPGLEVSVN